MAYSIAKQATEDCKGAKITKNLSYMRLCGRDKFLNLKKPGYFLPLKVSEIYR